MDTLSIIQFSQQGHIYKTWYYLPSSAVATDSVS